MHSARHIVTGGAGFLAGYLIKELASLGGEIVAFDNRKLAPHLRRVCARTILGDVRSEADVAEIGFRQGDTVYHLAARQFGSGVPRAGRDAWFSEVNVEGTRRVLSAMRRGGASRIVLFSTDMTYGVPERLPVRPDHPQRPLGPYGRSKVRAEGLVVEAARRGISATVFRPRLIAGRGRLGILAKLFALIRRGLPVPLIGGGSNRYQMVSAEDAAKAAVLAAEQGCHSGFFNLGSPDPPTCRELLGELISHAGSRSVLVPTWAGPTKAILAGLDAAGLSVMYPEQFLIADRDIILDTSKTEAVLGWSATQGDADIMRQAYDSYLAETGG